MSDGLPQVREAVARLPAYQFTPLQAAVKLDQNESPFDIPDAIKQEAVRNAAQVDWNRYPDIAASQLRVALAQHAAWPADGLVVAPGSNVLVQALILMSGVGRSVLTLDPTFSLYAQQASLFAGTHVRLPLTREWSLPLTAMQAVVSEGSGVAFVPTPLAPTGNGVPAHTVAALREALAPGWLLVIDEAYGEFSTQPRWQFDRDDLQVVRLRTFSKAFGAAGLRLGYALLHPRLASELRKVLLPFSISVLQESVALTLLTHADVLQARVASIVAERARVSASLRTNGAHVIDSESNALLVITNDAARVHAGLLQRGVLVRRQDSLPGLHGGIRVTIGSRLDNDAFLNAWQALPSRDTILGGDSGG